MDSRRTRNFRNNFDRKTLDKKVDKIFETGRQLVDGVSGNRPGKRRNADFQEISRRNVRNVGKWVTEKMDSFLDEDENEDWYDEERRDMKAYRRETKSHENFKYISKRPLEALSLRQPKNIEIEEPKKLPYSKSCESDEWPDDSDYKVARWQRPSENNIDKKDFQENHRSGLSKVRLLPKSRRRRI